MEFRMYARRTRGPVGRRLAGHQDGRRPPATPRLHVDSLEDRCVPSVDPVLQFNAAALSAIRADRPTIAFVTRDLAIIHAAIYDAVNAIDQTGTVFHVPAAAPPDASPEAAAAAAGLFTGSALFPTHKDLFQAAYQATLADVPDGAAKDDGIAVGRFVAEQTLIGRIPDGSDAVVHYTPGDAPGDWRPTLPAFAPAQTPQWPQVAPFALDSASQFLPPPPPDLTSAQYTADYNEVKDLGRSDSTVRTPEQTAIARFWEAKAGTPQIAGYWNEIAAAAATSRGNTLDQNARLFAQLNVTLADNTIAFFDAKYTYNRWRPITAIQLAGETGNPDTVPDPDWLPLLNTAPHPAYVSAHGATSGAAAKVLKHFFGTDRVSFSLTSEDLPGVSHSFTRFSAAADEAMQSVIYAGVHFRSDNIAGNALGRSVAQFVVQNFFRPVHSTGRPQARIVSDLRALTVQAVDRLFGLADPPAASATTATQAAPERLPARSALSPTTGAGALSNPQDSAATPVHEAPRAGEPFAELGSGAEVDLFA